MVLAYGSPSILMAPQINGLGVGVGSVTLGLYVEVVTGKKFWVQYCLATGHIFYRFRHKILELIVYRS